MFTIVLLGAPGAGKGTQAKLIAENFHFAHISTGDLFRNNIKNSTPLGLEAKSYIDRGALCPDSLTINMLHDHLQKLPCDIQGCILDGVPRTIEQANMLAGIDYSHQLPINLVVNLVVDQDEISKRMIKRAEIEHRSDDTPEVIKQRLANYFAQTKPLEDYYAAKGILRNVDGIGTVEEIFARVADVIEKER